MQITTVHTTLVYSSFVDYDQNIPVLTTTTTTNTTILRLSGFCLGQPGWASTRRNIHPLTPIVVISHPLSASSIFYDPWHLPCSIYMPESFSKISIQVFLGLPGTLHSILHTFLHPNIVFFFTAHAHTIATCFAVVPKLCHLILVSLSTLYLELYLVASFSFLMGHVSLPCNILLHTQLLYNLSLNINEIALLVSSGTNYAVFILVWFLVTATDDAGFPSAFQHMLHTYLFVWYCWTYYRPAVKRLCVCVCVCDTAVILYINSKNCIQAILWRTQS